MGGRGERFSLIIKKSCSVYNDKSQTTIYFDPPEAMDGFELDRILEPKSL